MSPAKDLRFLLKVSTSVQTLLANKNSKSKVISPNQGKANSPVNVKYGSGGMGLLSWIISTVYSSVPLYEMAKH